MGVSVPWLWWTTLLTSCALGSAFTCPHPLCTCPLDKKELQCTIDGDLVTISYAPNLLFKIECRSYRPDFDYGKIPAIGSGSVQTFQLDRCALPDTSIGRVISGLGFTQATYVNFRSFQNLSNTIRKEHLADLGALNTKRLLLWSNGLTDVPVDLFEYAGDITWLSFFDNNINIPPGFFEYLPKLETLELSNNHLTDIPEGMLSNLTSLKRLIFWNNSIHNLTQLVFEDLRELTELDLTLNQLTALHPHIFHHLEQLTSVSLRNNNFSSLPANLFSNNRRLETVNLNNNNVNLTRLPDRFLSDMRAVKDVELYRIGLREISEDIFANSTNILNISLAYNYIEVLPPLLFKDQKNLLKLNLNNNKIVNISSTLFEAQGTLTYLDLSYNHLENIASEAMERLVNLETLDLSHNRLSSLRTDLFPLFNSLRFLDLSHNQLDFSQLGQLDNPEMPSPLQKLKKLKTLDLSYNNISMIYFDWCNTMLQLEILNLSHNKIKFLGEGHLNFLSSSPLAVDLTHNLIASVEFPHPGLMIPAAQPRPPPPQVLLGENPFVCDCELTYFVQYIQSQIKDREFQKGQSVFVDVEGARCASSPAGAPGLVGRALAALQPTELVCRLEDDADAACPRGCVCLLRRFTDTLIFDCSDGAVDAVPTIPPSVRSKNVELRLQNDRLESIGRGAIPPVVTHLYLDGNNLTDLYWDDLPAGLQLVSVRGNRLGHVNASSARALLERPALADLRLADNPLACDCPAAPFLSLLYVHKDKVSDLSSLRCPDGSPVAALQTGALCAGGGLVGAACVAALGLLAGLAAGAYYKYNHHIKVYLFARGLCLRLIAEEEVDRDKKYDAFVAYSHKDESFVINELIGPLEKGAFPFKLCVHCRDWVAGDVVHDQIARSVRDSRRTIVVLSRNFVDSEWGRTEFRLAHEHAMKERRSRVIVVVYGDVDAKALDEELRAYLTTNTYVKWGDPWFFDKLRYALPHPARLARDALHASLSKKKGFDDRLELIDPAAPTSPGSTPPAHQPSAPTGAPPAPPAPHAPPLAPITKFPVYNAYTNGSITMNGLKVNGNAKHSEV